MSETQNDESDDNSTLHQICQLVSKQLKLGTSKKKKTFSKASGSEFKPVSRVKPESKNESITKSVKTEVSVDLATVVGATATICFNCRRFGHSREMCTAPRTQSFCYNCGGPGVYTGNCPAQKCTAKREQKN